MSHKGLVIDTAAALERIDGDREFLSELAELFLEETPKILDEIRSAIDRGDSEALARSAHSLKGSAANLAAQTVSDLSRDLEEIGQSGELERGRHALRALEDSLDHLSTELRSLV